MGDSGTFVSERSTETVVLLSMNLYKIEPVGTEDLHHGNKKKIETSMLFSRLSLFVNIFTKIG